MEQLDNGDDIDRLQLVWDAIRQERCRVKYNKIVFPALSGNLSLSQELIARGRSYLETKMKAAEAADRHCGVCFVRHVIAGGGNISSRMSISIWRSDGDTYIIGVEAYTHTDSHVQWDQFDIDIPAGCPHLADFARAVGLPDDFENSWDGYILYIYTGMRGEGAHTEDENNVRMCNGADTDQGERDNCGAPVEQKEDYETADEGEANLEVAEEG
ncbi:hypothetical protein EXIGLDRAFT_735087 [Exidia glandulosa HHB12029]|uniref:Uncharacterized protein n=1 Tax=Exidia glandulosa HHB12029 TaxID=1314781 RepID=A0A165JYF6_EXIGL|nr:hypothetical protein EXIGLDRAFT_735087 [Exidia glandulosa HHB12029]